MENEKTEFTELISDINDYYQDLLGYSVKETNLLIKEDSKGLYLPRNQTAIIPKEDKLGLFHEYFGHGLYCEQNLSGRKLVDLEKCLLKEEKEFFGSKKFSFEELEKFRKQNKAFLELQKFRDKNLGWFEGFAIFSEYFLSNKLNLINSFEKKYDSLPKEDKECFGKIINFNKDYGDLATFYSFGLAKKTTSERVKRLLEDVCGENLINNSKLVLLTGSKKPFSDIDLFSSSNYLQSTKNDWLDLVVFNEKEFERKVNLFEIQVTHPIFAGEFVAGDFNYLKEKRKQLIEQPITKEAIEHNFKKSEENRKLAFDYPEFSNERKIGLSYAETYLFNAIALRNGRKVFTKEKLSSYLQNEKFIELEGSKII